MRGRETKFIQILPKDNLRLYIFKGSLIKLTVAVVQSPIYFQHFVTPDYSLQGSSGVHGVLQARNIESMLPLN